MEHLNLFEFSLKPSRAVFKNPLMDRGVIIPKGQTLEHAGVTVIDGDGNVDLSAGSTNVMGNDAKTSYNKLTGYTKIDYRPTGGGTNSYAFQVRHNIGGTSGSFQGIDHESHIKATGTASLRGVQGVAVVDSGYTVTDGTLIGTYGQARADGTFAGSGLMAGLYGLIEASAAITASHVCSAWLDSHQANAVTGEHELLYMTNNGAATMDQAIFLYPGNKITHLITIDPTDTGLVGDATGETLTPTRKINVKIDGATLVIHAGTSA